MATRDIGPTDVIEIKNLPILIFGEPSVGKTSLAQTLTDPVTLDFDAGIRRCANRRQAKQFDEWEDCLDAERRGEFAKYNEIVVDTGGAMLEQMARAVIGTEAKYGYQGALTLQGYGVLGAWFNTWVSRIIASGKDLVFVCHQEEEKDASERRYLRPALLGKMAWASIHRKMDLMARLRGDKNKRYLDFAPSEYCIGKDSARLGSVPVPDLHQNPRFLADLLARAKQVIGTTVGQAAEAAQTVQKWQTWLDGKPDLTNFNAIVPDVKLVAPEFAQKQCWAICLAHAKSRGWRLDGKVFVGADSPVATNPPPTQQAPPQPPKPEENQDADVPEAPKSEEAQPTPTKTQPKSDKNRGKKENAA